MNKILVPVDGSEASLRALQTAISMAQEQKNICEVHVINVQPPIISNNVARFFTAAVLNDYYQDEGKEALKNAEILLNTSGLPHQLDIIVGHIADSVQGYISKHGCDHIVMGTRGLGAVPGLLLGSAATKILSTVAVPVTLIK